MNDAEFAACEKEREKKNAQREYYKERDQKMEAQIKGLNPSLKELVATVNQMSQCLQAQQQMQAEANSGLNDPDYMLKKVGRERAIEAESQRYNLEFVGDREYSLFCVWCNAFKAITKPNGALDMPRMKSEVYTNDRLFREYCKEEPIKDKDVPARLIKQYIAEKYLGLEYYRDENDVLRVRKA